MKRNKFVFGILGLIFNPFIFVTMLGITGLIIFVLALAWMFPSPPTKKANISLDKCEIIEEYHQVSKENDIQYIVKCTK